MRLIPIFCLIDHTRIIDIFLIMVITTDEMYAATSN